MENIFQSFQRWVLLAEGWMVKFKWAAKIDTQAIVSRLGFIFQEGEQRRHERIGDKFNQLCHNSWAMSSLDINLRRGQKLSIQVEVEVRNILFFLPYWESMAEVAPFSVGTCL